MRIPFLCVYLAALSSMASAQLVAQVVPDILDGETFDPTNTTFGMPTKALAARAPKDTDNALDLQVRYWLRPLIFLCELSDIKGYCTWFKFTTEYCYNLRPGDINAAAGLAGTGFNKIRSAWVAPANDCKLYLDKDCRAEKQFTYIQPQERKLDLGSLNDHVQSIYCLKQTLMCKTADGTILMYNPAPLPPNCTPWTRPRDG